ncbi:MAG: gliding motility-associated C-terminal domain-containing protein [Bacteroidetes bacterium]|nr:gliding motility-associated C-terminal domain-containing protein [Bacteroidota bacterium]
MTRRIVKNIVFILANSLSACLLAVTQPPAALRACLDRTTGIVTVYMRPVADGCGSFSKYRLYGRDDIVKPFSLLGESTTLGSIQMTALLSSKKKWELYISALYACNGTDSFNSNIVFIDDTPPAELEPDSVSVDYSTQRLIAGWKKAPEPDILGYSIFKVDPANGNNTVIDEKDVTQYLFTTATFNTNQSGIRVALAPYDSCRNGATISNYHSPILLTYSMSGANAGYRCDRKFRYSWTSYTGWTTDHYTLWAEDLTTGNWLYLGTVPSGTNSFTWNIPFLDHTYNFIVRAHTAAGTSSTSNRITVSFPDFAKPAYNTLGHVSVIGAGVIEITGTWDPAFAGITARLEKKTGSTWNSIKTLTESTPKFTHRISGLNTNSQEYTYRLVLYNSCPTPIDSSTEHTSLLLTRNYNNLQWKSYTAWSGPSENQEPNQRNKQSSTWNRLAISPATNLILTDTLKPECYRIESFRIGINGKVADTAYSNELCLTAVDTTLIPSGFSPGGINPIFKISNPNLSRGQAKMSIYNRWGEKIWEGEALDGWDGTDRKGNFLGPGAVVYLVEILRPEKRETFKGVVYIVR